MIRAAAAAARFQISRLKKSLWSSETYFKLIKPIPKIKY